jgi:hypothetical protein
VLATHADKTNNAIPFDLIIAITSGDE